jgi:hypothetical protein
MHREVRDHLEEVLADSAVTASRDHLDSCPECRDEIATMREQAILMRGLRAEAEPRAGFYARVMERIESQRVVSIWTLFSESTFARRIAVASMALALSMGVYLFTSERSADEETVVATQGAAVVPGEDQPGAVLTGSDLDKDSVLVNLVTYREQ